MRIDVDTPPLDLDTAIPCGLIVNELVANSLEHAFPQHKGVISIEFRTEADLQILTVWDNGIGLSDDFDAEETQSLGLKLVAALARQLDGQLRCEVAEGARFSIRFAVEPLPSEVVAI